MKKFLELIELDQFDDPVLTLQNDTHGTVTSSPAAGQIAAGTTVTLTTVPASGYVDDEFEVTGEGYISGKKFVMPSTALTIKAKFKQQAATLYKVYEDVNCCINGVVTRLKRNMKPTYNTAGKQTGYALEGSGATIDADLAAYLATLGLVEAIV